MLSETLLNLLTHMEQNVDTATKQEAVRGARLRLTKAAETTACYRCSKAGWLVEFGPLKGHSEWLFGLAKCGAGMVLPPFDDGFGLAMPLVQFCSGQFENSSDDQYSGSVLLAPVSHKTSTTESSKPQAPRSAGG